MSVSSGIVLGCSDSWSEQTPTMYLYPSPTGVSLGSTLSSWMHCEPPSLPPSTSYYTVISSSMLSHLRRVCHDSTAATIYRFLSMTIEADQHDGWNLHSSAACWHHHFKNKKGLCEEKHSEWSLLFPQQLCLCVSELSFCGIVQTCNVDLDTSGQQCSPAQ